MGFDPEHILAAQQRLERNRNPKGHKLTQGVPDGEEIEKLHTPTLQWLKTRGLAYCYNRPDKESTATPGVPDFAIVIVQETVWIEYKTKTGKVKPKQVEWHFLAWRQGVTVHVLRSFEEFLKLMKDCRVEE